jgi:hypothetical protein
MARWITEFPSWLHRKLEGFTVFGVISELLL